MSELKKYPRTPHLPWSPGGTADDAYLIDTAHFKNREIIITEKMDGENTTMYRNAIHARSVDSRHHPSRDWVKALHGTISHEIPEGWRFCGENVYARHSIPYENLESYFYLFSIWDSTNTALSWEATVEWATMLDLTLAPEFYRGPWDEPKTRALTDSLDPDLQEGLVVRITDPIPFGDFQHSIAKWVRSGHVQTDQHWMFAEIIPNGLA